jgi:tetratricopeptide (TPR) repeat protein
MRPPRPDGGNRPPRPDGIGGRPTPLPGDVALGDRPRPGGWNRPGRPEIGGWPDRPGSWGNRPGIGDGNNWNSGNWNSGNSSVWNNWTTNTINQVTNNSTAINTIGVNAGGWRNPGWGYGGWANPGWGNAGWGYGGWGNAGWGYPGWGGNWPTVWNTGYVNPHYGGWYNGCWTGNWGNWWTPLALGAATWGVASTVANWGLGYSRLGYAGNAYVNPYYVAAAASPYDYSQPIVVNNYIPPAAAATDGQATGAAPTPAPPAAPPGADAAVDAALEKFRAGDYVGALAGFDRALAKSPNDSVIHEVRALTLFALGRYTDSAAALNAVLAVAPGMDWTTVSNLYPSIDTYTGQLRRLEDFCRGNREDAAARFVLAYHYLVAGHGEEAADELEQVVRLQPQDVVARRLLEALRPAPRGAAAEAGDEARGDKTAADKPDANQAADATGPARPQTDLVGRWKATSDGETVELEITADSTFTWKATSPGRPVVELSGGVETAADAIRLESESAGAMVARVAPKGPNAFEFSLPGAPADVAPLVFQRQAD